MTANGPRDFWMTLHSSIVLLGMGGFIAWAVFAPLAEGVTTSGQIVVEQNRKTLQHLEGGIVRGIFVEEGEVVEQNDVLFEIDTLSIEANRDQIAYERASLIANRTRVGALLNGRAQLNLENTEAWGLSQAQSAEIVEEQQNLFREQTRYNRSKLALLNQRITSLGVGATERARQIDALEDSLRAVESELGLTDQLVDEQLATSNETLRLERERASLRNERSRLIQQDLEAQAQILELEKEILQVKAENRERWSQELVEMQTAIARANEQLRSVEDAIVRSQVLAPSAGKVMNLKFTTIGGVVQPGEPMLEIVPETDGSWALVQILPADRETVVEGMTVRLRLSGFKSWQSPDISGKIVTISADLKQVPETGMSFYEARILLDSEALQASQLPEILPGMPVEVFIASNTNRTLAGYLLEPISAHIKRGLSSG